MGFHSSGQAAPLSVLYDLLGEKQTGADTVKKYFFFGWLESCGRSVGRAERGWKKRRDVRVSYKDAG